MLFCPCPESRQNPPVPVKADYCEPVIADELQEVLTTPATSYFMHHPAVISSEVPTVIFLPGGSGNRRVAESVWMNFLWQGEGLHAFRIVVPYSVDLDLFDDVPRVFRIREEVLACFGGDPGKVHIAGTSNEGHMAFYMLMTRAQLIASLLGASGEFPTNQPDRLVEALSGRAVPNGVGANDEDWKPGVLGTHKGFIKAGGDSVYVEFAGEGHQVSAEFDETIVFEFWTSH